MRSIRLFSLVLMSTILCVSNAMGQAGSPSVVIGGHVSEAVFLSIAPAAQVSNDSLRVSYTTVDSHTVLVTITMHGNNVGRINIPVQLRSNVGYTLSALASSRGATLRGLRLIGARATGRFVTSDAVAAANIACEASNGRIQVGNADRPTSPFSSPTVILAGPRISRTGPLSSPFNAVEVTMLADVEAQQGQETRIVELILSAFPNRTSSTLIDQK